MASAVLSGRTCGFGASIRQAKCWLAPRAQHLSKLRLSPPRLGRRGLGVQEKRPQGRVPHLTQRRHLLAVRASSEDPADVAGPLSPESPSGQLLRELLQKHPHLVPSAAEQQLEQLAKETEVEGGEGEEKKTGSELVLYRRIAEMRKQERTRAVEEVIYSLIVQKFIEAGAPLLPKVPFVPVNPNSPLTLGMMGMVPSVPSKHAELEAAHSPEALELVREHLERVLGGRGPGGLPEGVEDRVLVGASKLRLGQVYAASIMYGYFLKRVDQRFQLEKGVRLMLGGGDAAVASAASAVAKMQSEDEEARQRLEEEKKVRMEEFLVPEEEGGQASSKETKEKDSGLLGSGLLGGLGGAGIASAQDSSTPALRQYISSFDSGTLQNAVTVRSLEGMKVVERHTEALFGKPDVVAVEGGVAVVKDDQAHITVSTLKRLMLEAVAFGNFLWDVETYVDSQCKIAQ